MQKLLDRSTCRLRNRLANPSNLICIRWASVSPREGALVRRGANAGVHCKLGPIGSVQRRLRGAMRPFAKLLRTLASTRCAYPTPWISMWIYPCGYPTPWSDGGDPPLHTAKKTVGATPLFPPPLASDQSAYLSTNDGIVEREDRSFVESAHRRDERHPVLWWRIQHL